MHLNKPSATAKPPNTTQPRAGGARIPKMKWCVNIPAEPSEEKWYVVGDKIKALTIASVTRQDATRNLSAVPKTCIDEWIYAHEKAEWMADNMASVKEQSDFNQWLKTDEFAQICEGFGVDHADEILRIEP